MLMSLKHNQTIDKEFVKHFIINNMHNFVLKHDQLSVCLVKRKALIISVNQKIKSDPSFLRDKFYKYLIWGLFICTRHREATQKITKEKIKWKSKIYAYIS